MIVCLFEEMLGLGTKTNTILRMRTETVNLAAILVFPRFDKSSLEIVVVGCAFYLFCVREIQQCFCNESIGLLAPIKCPGEVLGSWSE